MKNLIDRLLADGEQVTHEASRRARIAVTGEDRGPGWIGGALLAIGGAAAGAVLAMLMDPDRGRSRRARLADQAAATVRRGVRGVERTARRLQSDVTGRVTAMQHASDEGDPFPDDVTLASKVQTELFRDPAVPKGSINVNVERGIVVLRGEVPDDAMRGELVSRVETMAGVWAVRNLLHLPGEAAPSEAVATA
jgi:osmotically-inducible protein OsmY